MSCEGEQAVAMEMERTVNECDDKEIALCIIQSPKLASY